jgi:hypothetical protein
MRFLQILAIVLTQLSISSLLITSVVSPATIRQGFFRFQCLVCGLSASLALLITKFIAEGTWRDVRFLAFTILGAVFGYTAFRFDRPVLGRFFMIMAGLLGVVFGLLPLAGRTLAQWGIRTKAMVFFDGGFLLGAALIGTTFVSLVLAYGYRALRNPTDPVLLWLVEGMLVAAGLRAVMLVTTLVLLGGSDPALARELIAPLRTDPAQFWVLVLRIATGLAVPALFGVRVVQRIREQDYERASRGLLVAGAGVFLGECCAVHLLV